MSIGKDKTRKIVTMTKEQGESIKELAEVLNTTQNNLILVSIAYWIHEHIELIEIALKNNYQVNLISENDNEEKIETE